MKRKNILQTNLVTWRIFVWLFGSILFGYFARFCSMICCSAFTSVEEKTLFCQFLKFLFEVFCVEAMCYDTTVLEDDIVWNGAES